MIDRVPFVKAEVIVGYLEMDPAMRRVEAVMW
jgi:hypothetical protein